RRDRQGGGAPTSRRARPVRTGRAEDPEREGRTEDRTHAHRASHSASPSVVITKVVPTARPTASRQLLLEPALHRPAASPRAQQVVIDERLARVLLVPQAPG